jgi:hypothetical protein
MLAAALVALVSALLSVGPAPAADCNVDCNARCCHTVKITPWDKNRVCEPTCKTSCEAAKVACRGSGGVIPPVHSPSVIEQIQKALRASCAAGFQVINNAVILSQGSYAAGSERLLVQARDLLIQAGLFNAQEFNNVSIRWARLVGAGQTPDRNVVLINEDYLRNNDLYSTATTLGHEMVHVRQYRRMGTDHFKCEYSRYYVGCGCRQTGNGLETHCGCQDSRHPLEAEAYRWNIDNNPRVAQFAGGAMQTVAPQPMPQWSYICDTPALSCMFQNPAPRGAPCQCQTTSGLFIGRMR